MLRGWQRALMWMVKSLQAESSERRRNPGRNGVPGLRWYIQQSRSLWQNRHVGQSSEENEQQTSRLCIIL